MLASKLLRALDNPSPPPSPTFPTPEEMEGVEVGETEEEINSSGECEILSSTMVNLLRDPASPLHPSPSISSLSSESDLMAFDSADNFSKQMDHPSISLPVGDVAQDPPSPVTLPDSPISRFPENHWVAESIQGSIDILVDVDDRNSFTPSPMEMESDQKASKLEKKSPTPNYSLGPSCDLVGSLQSTSQTLEIHTAEDLPHTPLRRSSRPRKSVTSHLHKHLAASSPPTRHLTPSAGQGLKGGKGKERAVTPLKTTVTAITRVENEPQDSSLRHDEGPSDTRAQRRYSRLPTRRELTRELGVLSPNPANLSHPIPSVLPTTELSYIQNVGAGEQAQSSTFDYLSLTKVKTAPDALHQEHVSSTLESESQYFSIPARIPVTLQGSHVPSKLQLQIASVDDPSHTPARRIPLEQAVVLGHISPHKLLRMQTGTPALLNRVTGQVVPVLNALFKGNTSPTRRIFNASSTSREIISEPGNPLKHRSPEPFNRLPNHMTSTSASPAEQVAPTSRSARIPLSLVAPVKTHSEKSGHSGSTSPAKSALKQTTSRIPRSKPYSKPNVVLASYSVEQKPTTNVSTICISSNITATTNTRVTRAVDFSKSSRSKIDQAASSFPPDATTSSASSVNPRAASLVKTSGGLKRKRPNSKIGPVASSRSTTLRQVRGSATSTTSVSRPTHLQRTASPPPKSRSQSQTISVVKFKRVMPLTQSLPPPPHIPEEKEHILVISPPTEHGLSCPSDRETMELIPGENIVLSPSIKGITPHSFRSSSPTMIPLPSSPPPPPPTPLVFLIDPLSPVSQTEAAPSSNIAEGLSQGTDMRRKVRRKTSQAQPGTDMFGNGPNTTSNIYSPQRRRASITRASNTDDVLSGMSINALKALTANNTARNQYYAVAMLETQLVRKDGVRPESPAVKVKTISQRRQEEKVRQREERAARRARRYRGDSPGDEENNDQRYKRADLTSDFCGLHLWKPLVKHKRGAGDEEDYETPLKNIDWAVNGERRVKWDKGLFTEVFLDEVILGSKVPPKENVPTKGCLTQSAKVSPGSVDPWV